MWATTPTAGVTYSPNNMATTPGITFNNAGTYTVMLMATNAGGTAMATQTINVNSSPSLTIVSTSSVLCVGHTATITASGGTTYTWTSPASNSPSIAVSPTVTTIYSINSTNANGCSSFAIFTQTVSPCTGVESIAGTSQNVSLYPNPNNGNFTIQSGSDITLSIVNELGQLVKTINLDNSNNHQYVIDGLQSGIYFVTGNNGTTIVRQKVVVAK
jgi:PKD repeat protein